MRSGESLVALVLVVMGFVALGTASFPPLFASLSRGGPTGLLIIAATGAVSTVMLAGVIALLYRAWLGGRSA